MSMIVARMQKMKAENLVGIGNHNQRKTKNHSNPDIDTSLSKLNYDLVDRTQNYKTDIENFINENKTTTRAVRKDAVLVNEWIISSDKDFFDNLTESEIENFFERSKDYFAEKFGEKNIRYATVHLDESESSTLNWTTPLRGCMRTLKRSAIMKVSKLHRNTPDIKRLTPVAVEIQDTGVIL